MSVHGYFSDDTIAAIATSMGTDAGVGIIRVSGSKCLNIFNQLTRKAALPPARMASRVVLYDSQNDQIDDGLVLYFEDGASFTGEPVIEFQIHGGRYVLQRALKAILATGLCRMAGPGEFSFRAVKNNKLKLDEADAINQLIKAKNSYEAWSARQNISGARRGEFKSLQLSLHHLLAQVELSIDFIDQDVDVIPLPEFRFRLTQIIEDVDRILSVIKLSQRVAKGPLVVFYGEPNVGKSTLFNTILSEDRAIVSDIPGTTRDVITEALEVGPYTVRLADTAGIRDSVDQIEAEGVLRTKKQIDDGDVRVLLLCRAPSEEECKLTPDIVLITKGKLRDSTRNNEILQQVRAAFGIGTAIVTVSASENDGLDAFLSELKRVLDNKFAQGIVMPLPSEYQMQVLIRLRAVLNVASEVLDKTGTNEPEILSSVLFRAAQALTDVCGETNTDTILNKIFSEFCIGK